jgi:hypothetical protein
MRLGAFPSWTWKAPGHDFPLEFESLKEFVELKETQ